VVFRTLCVALVPLLVGATTNVWGAPLDYLPPAPIPGDGPFWRVHRFDLEGCVDDRGSLKDCVLALESCEAKRLEDVTTPPEGLAMSWWQAALATVLTIVVALAAERGLEEVL
jgi:hypothetical protein